MSIDKIIDLRHTPALRDTDNASHILDAVNDILDALFVKGITPEAFILTPHQAERLTKYVNAKNTYESAWVEHEEPEPTELDKLFGIPVEVIADIFPYLIGGEAHGLPVPKIPTFGTLKVPAPGSWLRKHPDPCGGYIDYGYREIEYRRCTLKIGRECIDYYTCCEGGDDASLLIREMRRAVVREAGK